MSSWLLARGQVVKAHGPQLAAGIAFVVIALFTWLRLTASREGLSRLLKSLPFFTGLCPFMHYNRQLILAILNDRVEIAKNVNATVLPLDQAPQGYADFDKGAASKFVLDPHGMIKK